ncbi:MAG: tetratricopeptide repeat protein, partial [Anaerolineae bacterium]
ASLPALQDALARQTYHVLHYTGHGVYDGAAQKGHLCFEDDVGQTRLVEAGDLRPLLVGARDLRLEVLSACQSAQTGDLDAFEGVATGLLQADVPAVLAMQFSILDSSAIEMARVFYTALARGRTPAQALSAARQAMRALDRGRPSGQRRFDWGVPALYLRAQGMRLIDPDVDFGSLRRLPKSVDVRDTGGLPLPRVFVGRRASLRQLRRALRQRTPALYLRGIGGIGKSALAAKLLDRPGADLDATLVIRCNELPLPTEALGKLASFWSAQGAKGHAQAAALLLDSRQDPTDRARQALQSIADRRYLVVFDNLESWFEEDERQRTNDEHTLSETHSSSFVHRPSSVKDETMRGVLRGLLTARSRSTFLFTGRYRWAGLEALPAQNRLEIHLDGLTLRQALLLMNELPRLAGEPLADKLAVYGRVGGHPKTIELLDGWLSDGRRLRALLDDPALGEKLAEEWERYFLDDLLGRLSPAEREALTTLSILEEPFWRNMARDLLGGDWILDIDKVSNLLTRLLDLSLIQFHAPGTKAPWYATHPVVRAYLLGRLEPEGHRALHARAAAFYSAPFVEAARQAVAQSGQTATDERIEGLARSDQGAVGAWPHQTQDMDHARWAVARALAWQSHLFQAGQFDAAGEIVTAVWEVLDRWGQRDQAKALLRRSIKTREGPNRAVAQGNLATMLQKEGRLAEALAIHQQLYETFAALDARQQMATALAQMSIVYQIMGKYDTAIEKQEASLQIRREIEDEEGQAISLHQVSMLYRMKEDYPTALARSREAEEPARKVGNQALFAATLHEQGIIFYLMDRPDDAFERFRESLEIKRRIGDESGAADSLGELGKLLGSAGQMREAIAAFSEALEIYQRLGSPKMGIALEMLGFVHEQQGEYAAALEKYRQARVIYQQAIPANLPIIERLIARVQEKMGG